VRARWGFGLLSVWFVACLNPMPEEFPVHDGDGVPAGGDSAETPGVPGAAGSGALDPDPDNEEGGGESDGSGGAGGSGPSGDRDAGASDPDAGAAAAPADAGSEVLDGGL
jgi:hypothetical protein